jgi:hypothetical protein
MVEIQSKKYDTIQQSLGPASNLHAPGSRCPPPLPSRGLWHHWSTDHVRIATIDTYLLTCRMSLFLSGFHDGLLSWGSLSLESGCCSCCADVHVMLKSFPLALLRDVLRDGRNRRTDGLRDETLPASSVSSSSHGKREKENSRNGVFLWGIFSFWRNNYDTK